MKYKNVRFILGRQTQADVSKSQYKQLIEVIDKLKLHRFFKIYGGPSGAGTKMILCKLTGSYTINVGTKEPQTLMSLAEITHGWIEEAGHLSMQEIVDFNSVVRSKSAGVPCKVLYTFNPTSRDKAVYKMFFTDEHLPKDVSFIDGKRSDTYYNRSFYNDNPHLEESYEQSLELYKYSKHLYARFVAGEFVDEEFGEIFNPSMIKEYGGGCMGKGVLYIDIATKTGPHNDYTAIVKASSDKSYIYIEDAFVGRVEYPNIVDELKKMSDEQHTRIGYDGWGQSDATFKNELKHHNIDVRFAYPMRFYADSYVETMLRLFVSERILFSKKVRENKLFMEQLFNFTSKKDDKHDDSVDALFGAVLLLTERGYFKNK